MIPSAPQLAWPKSMDTLQTVVSFRQPCVAGGVRSCGPPVVASSGGPQRTGGRPRGSAQTLRWTGQRYC